MGAITGDFVFVGDLGRPDLLESAADVEEAVRDFVRIAGTTTSSALP